MHSDERLKARHRSFQSPYELTPRELHPDLRISQVPRHVIGYHPLTMGGMFIVANICIDDASLDAPMHVPPLEGAVEDVILAAHIQIGQLASQYLFPGHRCLPLPVQRPCPVAKREKLGD